MSKISSKTLVANEFDLSGVKLGRPLPTVPVSEIIWPTDGKIEALGVTTDRVVAMEHNWQEKNYKYSRGPHLFDAVHLAYNQHYPLVLSPDVIWLTIAQALSKHVNYNAEGLRKKFVDHEGQQDIIILSPGIKGSPFTPWQDAVKNRSDIPLAARAKMQHQASAMGTTDESVLDKFVNELRSRVKGDVVDTIMPTFSTTTIDAHAAMAVTTMATFKAYFKYTMMTLCGIPRVTLLGEVDDWKSIRERADKLADYDLDFWLQHLLPVLDKFVESAGGDVDKAFWSNIIKRGGGSGGPYISGWVNAFFPYLKEDKRNQGQAKVNRHMDWQKPYDGFGGNHPGDYPESSATCPFTWNYYGTDYKMEFAAGVVGISQDPTTLALTPEIGWAVADVTNAPARSSDDGDM